MLQNKAFSNSRSWNGMQLLSIGLTEFCIFSLVSPFSSCMYLLVSNKWQCSISDAGFLLVQNSVQCHHFLPGFIPFEIVVIKAMAAENKYLFLFLLFYHFPQGCIIVIDYLQRNGHALWVENTCLFLFLLCYHFAPKSTYKFWTIYNGVATSCWVTTTCHQQEVVTRGHHFLFSFSYWGSIYLFIFFISYTMATSCWVEDTCLFLFLLVLPFSAQDLLVLKLSRRKKIPGEMMQLK